MLEIQDNAYTTRYGGDRVDQSSVVDIDATNPRATLIADLEVVGSLPPDAYDCIILTQTLNLLRRAGRCIENCFVAMRPGGLFLVTAPSVSRLSPTYADSDFWRFTPAGIAELFKRHWPDDFRVESFGNLGTCIAFLIGQVVEELPDADLDHHDPRFPLTVAVEATKTSSRQATDTPPSPHTATDEPLSRRSGTLAGEPRAAPRRYGPAMAERRAQTLLEMMHFIERFTLNRAWNALMDDELLWEPMPGCWTVRPVEESHTATPFVVGAWVADFDAALAAATEPLTSIAWLFWHVGSMPGRTAQLDFLGGAHAADSGWTSPYIAAHPIFRTAEEAVGTMRAGWRELGAALRSASDERLEQPVRFWGYGGPGPMGTGAQVVALTLNEVSHHGTQIGVLRDLYRLRAGASIECHAE